MINNMGLLHYLSEDTYKKICKKLNLDDSNSKNDGNFISNPDNPIFHINLFNIIYKQFGQIWFMDIYLNFPKFQCENTNFEKSLYKEYNKIFGKNVMDNFPKLEEIMCNYIEYLNIFNVNNAIEIEEKAKILGCSPVQLIFNVNNLKNKEQPHNKMHLCVSKIDRKNIQTLIHGFGSSLKKRIKDKTYYGPVGIKTPKMLEKQTEKEIVNWMLKKNNLDLKLE